MCQRPNIAAFQNIIGGAFVPCYSNFPIYMEVGLAMLISNLISFVRFLLDSLFSAFIASTLISKSRSFGVTLFTHHGLASRGGAAGTSLSCRSTR